MNALLVATFLVLSCATLVGQNKLSPKLVAEIPTGTQIHELGFTIGNEGGLPPSPLCFFFAKDATIGVIDRVNKRVQFFSNKTWEYQRTVERVDYPALVHAHEIGDNYWLYNTKSAFLVDSSFVMLKKIEASFIFSFVDGYLWTFNTFGKLECYDRNGVWLDEDETKALLRKLNTGIYSGNQYTEAIRQALQPLIETGEYLIVSGKIVPKTFAQANDFFSIFENSDWRDSKKDFRSKAPMKIDIGGQLDINTSDDGTTVWRLTDRKQHKDFVGVFSAFGDLVAFFSDEEINPFFVRKKLVAENKSPVFDQYIAPVARIDSVGDVYYMVGYRDHIRFYEARRSW